MLNSKERRQQQALYHRKASLLLSRDILRWLYLQWWETDFQLWSQKCDFDRKKQKLFKGGVRVTKFVGYINNTNIMLGKLANHMQKSETELFLYFSKD